MLFYSNLCEFSKEVVALVLKKDMRNMFMLVCIDSGKYTIPPVITKVPSILNAARTQVYTDGDIIQYIEQKSEVVTPKQDLQTFAWEGNGFSEYATIQEEDAGNITSKGYTYLSDYSTGVTASTFQDENDKLLKQAKFDSSSYDSFIAVRNRDEEHIKKVLQRNNVDRIV